MVEWFEILEGGDEQFRFRICEIAAGFGSQHFERVDHGLGGPQVHRFGAGLRVGDLAEEEPGILGLEDDEFVEPGIGFGRVWHGRNLERNGIRAKRKAEGAAGKFQLGQVHLKSCPETIDGERQGGEYSMASGRSARCGSQPVVSIQPIIMNKISFDLTGKIALVTGATHGIGMAISKGLAQQGAKICVNDIDDERLAACKAEYAKDGIDVFTLKFNVTDEADVDRGISKIEAEVGPIDILVNNAGIIKRVPILDMPIEDFRTVIEVDLVAPLIVAKRVVPSMIERRSGKIINMCSMLSVYGRQSVSAYASAKGGLKLLTQILGTADAAEGVAGRARLTHWQGADHGRRTREATTRP